MYRYRERERNCSSGSDDDDETSLAKLRNPHREVSSSSAAMDMDVKPDTPQINSSKKRKVNTIWSSVVQEQTINDDLCKVSMNRISDRLGWDRGCESYDFTRKIEDTRPDSTVENELDLDYGVSDIENEFDDSDTNQSGADKATRKKSDNKVPFVERIEDAQKIARDVARRLREPKVDLIERCIQVLGRKKVFDLLHMTEDIEESGGMLIVNGSRRRTPGGVFLFQLRKDPSVTKKEKNYIFAEDKEKEYILKKAQRKLVKRKNNKMASKTSKMEMEACITTGSVSEKPAQSALTICGSNVESAKGESSENVSDVELEEGEIP